MVMPVTDHAFSTAGDYERTYVVGGRRYHHIIDPRTGYPATASRSVTIWAPTALLADEIDDGVFILGPKRGLELVESLEGVGAVIVDSDGKVWTSKRLAGQVKEVHPPRNVCPGGALLLGEEARDHRFEARALVGVVPHEGRHGRSRVDR